jgi:hypothetical protein
MEPAANMPGLDGEHSSPALPVQLSWSGRLSSAAEVSYTGVLH